jgi:hypothetical protein
MSKAIPKLRTNARIEILWHDAHDVGDADKTWHDAETIETPKLYYECLSLGYFLKRENGFIYIAADLVGPHVSRVFAIPQGCVKAVKKL